MPVTYRELATIPLTQYSSSFVSSGTNKIIDGGNTNQSIVSYSSGSVESFNYTGSGVSKANSYRSGSILQHAGVRITTSYIGYSSRATTTSMGTIPLQTLRTVNNTTYFSSTGATTYTRYSYTNYTNDTYETYTTTSTASTEVSTVVNTTDSQGTNFTNPGTYQAASVYDTTLTAAVDETKTTATNYSAKTTESSTYTTATDATSTGSTTYLTDTTIPYTSTSLATTKTESKVYKTTSTSTGYSTPGMTTHSVSIPQYSENMYTQKSTLNFGDTLFFSEGFDETSTYARPRTSSSYAVPTTSATSNISWTVSSKVAQTLPTTLSAIVNAGVTSMTSQYTTGNQVSTTEYTTEYDSIQTTPGSITTAYSLEPTTDTSENTGMTVSTIYSTTIFDRTVPYIITYRESTQLNSTTVFNSVVTKYTTYTSTIYLATRIVNSSSSFSDTTLGANWTIEGAYTQQAGSTKISAAFESYPILNAYANTVQAFGGDYEQLIAVPSTNMTIYGVGLVGNDLLNVTFSSVYGNAVMAPFILTDQTYSTNQNSVSFTYTTDTGTGTHTSTTNSLSFVFSTITGAKTSIREITSMINGEITTVGHGFTTDGTLYVNGFYKINGTKTFTRFTAPISASSGQWVDAVVGYTINNFGLANPLFVTYTS